MIKIDFTHAIIVLKCSDDVVQICSATIGVIVMNDERQRWPDVQGVPRTSIRCANELQIEAKW